MATITPTGPIIVGAATVAPIAVQQDPTFVGFCVWVYSSMGVPRTALPLASPYLAMAYDTSINMTYDGLKLAPNRSPSRYRRPPPPPPAPANPIVPPPLPAHPIVPPPVSPIEFETPSIYAIAVYNLGGALLCEIAQDDPNAIPPQVPATFWADLRTRLGLNSFSLGIVNSASDQGTSAGQMIPNMIQDMSLLNLWLLKTPWGRMYLMIAGQWGAIWGIS